MVHRIIWRVGSEDALDFWEERLSAAGQTPHERVDGALRFRDPEGLEHELVVSTVDDQPLIAEHPEVPAEHALQGFEGARAFAADPERSRSLLEEQAGLRAGGQTAGRSAASAAAAPGHTTRRPPSAASRARAPSTTSRGRPRRTSTRAGASARSRAARIPTPVIDRFWFESIYFREPSGVLFEIATHGSGLRASTRIPSTWARALILPPFLEDRREEIERVLTPVENPRAAALARLSELVHRVREPAGDAQGALVLNHGRGADENDLFGLLDELDPERRLVGVTTGAPLTERAARRAGTGTWCRGSAIPDPATFASVL